MKQSLSKISRFHSLDALRGIAALSVVFWHWQHFFYSGTTPGSFDVERLPFFDWAFIFYTKGWLAVDLFFSLSGFIFYWLYSKPVAEGAISPGQFALLRISRLYPLHLATLLFVGMSQFWLLCAGGSYFVYPTNDAKHFLLNLLFVSSWGFESSYSFNGPIWSVSVEVLLYMIFFGFCRLLPIRAIGLGLISVGGFIVYLEYNPAIGRGIISFFLGGCVYVAYQAIVNSRHARLTAILATALMVCAWTATLIVASPAAKFAIPDMTSPLLLWHLEPSVKWVLQRASTVWPVLVLFPLTILSLALTETLRGTLGRRLSILGDISYSSYLLHFPLQILFFVVIEKMGWAPSVYYSPWFMGLFFAVLIATCLISYRFFEVPAQQFLRRSVRTRQLSARGAISRA